jgi:hypothetical protein
MLPYKNALTYWKAQKKFVTLAPKMKENVEVVSDLYYKIF